MLIIRIIALTIVTNFALFELVQTTKDKNFDWQKYLGVWYVTAGFRPPTSKDRMMCEWFNAKPQYECYGCFREVYGTLSKGQPSSIGIGIGIFDGTEMGVAYSGLGHASFTYSVKSFYNSSVLILHDKNDIGSSKMLSRDPIVSPDMKMLFMTMADSLGLQAVFVHPGDCPR